MQGLFDVLKNLGVGQRPINDTLFQHDQPLPKFGVFDLDDENLCHEVVKTVCHMPGCTFVAETLLDFENHYNASHRYSCSQCKKVLPSPHLLDIHIQEIHDSFFAVLSTTKPCYRCYNEDCKEKFMTASERLTHGVEIHRLPKNFRFDQSSIKTKNVKKQKINKVQNEMDVDSSEKSKNIETNVKSNTVLLKNNKQKTFVKYTAKKFTNEGNVNSGIDIGEAMSDLKNNLPN